MKTFKEQIEDLKKTYVQKLINGEYTILHVQDFMNAYEITLMVDDYKCISITLYKSNDYISIYDLYNQALTYGIELNAFDEDLIKTSMRKSVDKFLNDIEQKLLAKQLKLVNGDIK